MAGTEIILHLAGSANRDQVKATHLVQAGSQVGVVQRTYRPAGTYAPLPSPRPEPFRRARERLWGTASPADTRSTDKGGNR